jgi:hypothetical protein
MEQNQYGFFKNAVIDEDGALLVSATSTGFTSDLTSVLSEGNTTEGENIVLSNGDGNTTDLITSEDGKKYMYVGDQLGFGVRVDNTNLSADYYGSISIDRGDNGGTASGAWNLVNVTTNDSVGLRVEPSYIKMINLFATSDNEATIEAGTTFVESIVQNTNTNEMADIYGTLSSGNGEVGLIYIDGTGNSSSMYIRNNNISIDTLAVIINNLPTSSSGLTSEQLFTQTATELGGSGSTKVICII